MIIIKTEMSVRKINRVLLGLVLSFLSSEVCSKGEGKRKKKARRGTKREDQRGRERETDGLPQHYHLSNT